MANGLADRPTLKAILEAEPAFRSAQGNPTANVLLLGHLVVS